MFGFRCWVENKLRGRRGRDAHTIFHNTHTRTDTKTHTHTRNMMGHGYMNTVRGFNVVVIRMSSKLYALLTWTT